VIHFHLTTLAHLILRTALSKALSLLFGLSGDMTASKCVYFFFPFTSSSLASTDEIVFAVAI
jgi:hypothetical protein